MTGHLVSGMMWFLLFDDFTSYFLVILIYIPFALEYAFLSIFAAFVKLCSATVKNPMISFSQEISSVHSSA